MRARMFVSAFLLAAATNLFAQAEPKVVDPKVPDPKNVQPGEIRPFKPEAKAFEPPELAAQARKLIDADYLTPDEKKDRRIFHGVWKEDDLDTPQRKAAAALIRGAYLDPSLSDPAVAVEDRAEAMLLRGDLEEAIAALADATSLRATRIRAEALEGLGRRDEAARVTEPLIAALKEKGTRIADIVEGVRGLMIRARAVPQQEPAGGDFKRMESTLLEISQRIDRLYWPAMLAEAELLYDKDNSKQASEAAQQVLSLNPRCARAWAILGRITVDQFNFDATEKLAAQLTELLDASGDGPVSGFAAGILARARLRQNDPDGAAEVLRPAIEKFPRMRSLLAVQAATTALSYDFDKTEDLINAFEKLSPGSPEALFEVGRTLSEARQYEEAGKYLTRAAQRAPFWAPPDAELGLMSLQSGRDAEGLKNLKRAVELDPFNTRVSNSLSLATELSKYLRKESAHFIVRYAAGPDEVLATDMLSQLETMYKRVTGNGPGGIDHEPKGKTIIDLMPNQRKFAVRIAGVTRIHTMAASTGPTIAMEAPVEGPGHSIGTYDWLRVVRHEFTHTVTLSRTKNRIPHWFTEAAAVYMEDSPRDYQTCQLLEGALLNDALFDFSEINIAFVRPKKRTDRQQAYAQGHWMYEYMVERWGNRAPLDLMDRYAAGEREEAAMRDVLKIEQPQFLEDFKVWAGKQLQSWGMGRFEPSIEELLKAEVAEAAPTEPAKPEAPAPPPANEEPPAKKHADLPAPTLEMVNRWLAKYPEHPDVLELAVKLILSDNDGKPAEPMIPLLERYAKARSVDPLPHKLMARMYTARAAGDQWTPELAAKAIPHLEYLDAREQGSPAFAAELARAYQAAGRLDEAEAKADRACTIAPYDAGLRELGATIALSRADYTNAERQIIALTKLEPDRAIHKRRLDAVRKKAAENPR